MTTSKKKKKSARERRVLVASIICAGLIVAGSTFAWFTSTDDVTNRLTANADYGVSIVESFEPPANWIPGQDVNKDVYAVNTGNIDAFVKESISGKLTYTYETLTSTAPSGDATGYVELSSEDIAEEAIDGATTMEAGSFLAWTNTAEPLGEKSSARIEDGVENRWTPSTAGVYVFRRSISDNTFSYSGYYYGNGKYYKIVLGDDTYPATVEGANRVYDVITKQEKLGTGIKVDSEGKIISGTPDFSFVKEETKSNIDVTLAYEAASTAAGDAHPARLVASYKAAGSDAAAPGGYVYDSTATAARAEIDYLNAQGKNDIATKSYKLALADLAYASSLANASNDLIEAAKAQSGLINGTNGSEAKKNAADSARNNVNNSAANISGFTDNSLIYSTIVAPAVVNYAGTNANSAVAANYTKMQNLWNQMYGADGIASEITTALGTLANLTAAATAEDEAAQAATALTNAQTVKTKLAELKALMEQYKQAYADLDASTATVTGLTTTPGVDVAACKEQIQTFIGALPTDAANSLVTTTQSYKAAAENYKAAADAVTAGGSTWSAAINAYNSALSGASGDYAGVLGELGEPFTAGGSYDHRTTLAGTNGLNGTNELPDDAAYTVYAAVSEKDLPTDALQVKAPDPDRNANLTGATINDATKTVAEWKIIAGSTFAAEKNAELNSNSTPITIYINLAEGYDAEWEFDTSTDGTPSAVFYLKKILEASKTSEKLVDSVKLADTVTAGSYKDMTFDLNVGLESAQVTFDENNNIKTDAITTWSKQATVNQSNKTVSWN